MLAKGICGDIRSALAGGPREGASDQHTQPSQPFPRSLRIRRMSILWSEGSKLSIGHGNVVPVMAVRGTRSPEKHGGGHTVGGWLC